MTMAMRTRRQTVTPLQAGNQIRTSPQADPRDSTTAGRKRNESMCGRTTPGITPLPMI